MFVLLLRNSFLMHRQIEVLAEAIIRVVPVIWDNLLNLCVIEYMHSRMFV